MLFNAFSPKMIAGIPVKTLQKMELIPNAKLHAARFIPLALCSGIEWLPQTEQITVRPLARLGTDNNVPHVWQLI